ISVEVMPTHPSVYHVQRRRKIRTYGEGELAEEIRKGKLNGMELVRRDDETEWQPLFESRVYRREVPSWGDPRDAARMRMIRALFGHFTGFFITGVVMFSIQHQFPFWMWIWGAVLMMQAMGAAPG